MREPKDLMSAKIGNLSLMLPCTRMSEEVAGEGVDEVELCEDLELVGEEGKGGCSRSSCLSHL